MKHHYEYMRSLAASILLGGEQPFALQGALDPVDGIQPAEIRFFETSPPLDHSQRKIPYAFIEAGQVRRRRFNRNLKRLANGTQVGGPFDGKPTRRMLFRRYGEIYAYELHFITEDPSPEILSANTDRGIASQALRYISNNGRCDVGEFPCQVFAGPSTRVDDPARESGVYEVILQLEFHDGQYEIHEAPLPSGSLAVTEEVTIQ